MAAGSPLQRPAGAEAHAGLEVGSGTTACETQGSGYLEQRLEPI